MSQTLQALNSILKHKEERERQKIDRSLAMMDMATRLKQQKIENLRNNRLMDMRLREEGRDIQLHEKKMLQTEQALQKLKQEVDPEMEKYKKEKARLEVEAAEKDIEVHDKKQADIAFDNFVAVRENQLLGDKDNVINRWRNTGLQPIWDAVTDATADADFDIAEQKQVPDYIKGSDKNHQKLLNYVVKKHPHIISAIGALQLIGKDKPQGYESILESLSRISDDLITDKEFVSKFEKIGIDANMLEQSKNSLTKILLKEGQFDALKDSAQLQSSILNAVKSGRKQNELNIFFDALLKQTSQVEGAWYPPTEEEMRELLEQNPDLDPEDFK